MMMRVKNSQRHVSRKRIKEGKEEEEREGGGIYRLC